MQSLKDYLPHTFSTKMSCKARKRRTQSRCQNSWEKGKRNSCEEGKGEPRMPSVHQGGGDPYRLEQAKVEMVEYLMGMNVLRVD